MRSLSGALSAALGAPVQQPAILVQVDFSTPRRWSSFATVTWNGFSWNKEDVRIDGLVVDPLRVRGTLVVGNADSVMAALVLSEDIADRRVQIWGYDAAATALADMVPLCDAVGARASIDDLQVSIDLRAATEFVQCPRTFVTEPAGFSALLPAGAVLKINGMDFRLERR